MEQGKSLAEGRAQLLKALVVVNQENPSMESNVKGKVIRTYVHTVFWDLLLHLHIEGTLAMNVWQGKRQTCSWETQDASDG